jgi:ABC-type nitrate/sulfonate/bicarbonate transport system permease component
MKLKGKLLTRLVQFGFLAGIVLIWHALTATGSVNPLILPSVPSVWTQFEKLIASGAYWPHLQVTLYEYLVAMCIFIPTGLTIGYLVSRSRYAVRTFDPLFSGLYAIPQIILLPVYILYFGLGPGSKIAVGTVIGFFPVVLNTIAGFSSVDPLYITAARSMGASGFKMFWSVMVPAAWPVVVTGLRIGLIISFLSILGTETIVSLSGLGHRIVTLAELLNTSLMFAYIAFAIIVAVVLNYVVSAAEARGRRH